MAEVHLEEEFRKNPELTEDDLEHLRQWNRKQPHLPTIPDLQLVLFLHSCHWSLERAKATIEVHCSVKTFVPELFREMDPMSVTVQETLSVYEISPLPQKDSDDNLLVCMRMRDKDPSRTNIANLLRLQVLANMMTSRAQGTCSGYKYVYDMTGVVSEHLVKLSLALPLLRKYLTYLQEGLPLRLKAVHVINASSLMDTIMNWTRPFFNNQLLNMFHIHKSGMDELYNHIPRALLPKDFGGDLGDFREMTDNFKAQLEENREWFLVEQKMKSDESKRVGKAKDTGELFGLEGSFKKLEID